MAYNQRLWKGKKVRENAVLRFGASYLSEWWNHQAWYYMVVSEGDSSARSATKLWMRNFNNRLQWVNIASKSGNLRLAVMLWQQVASPVKRDGTFFQTYCSILWAAKSCVQFPHFTTLTWPLFLLPVLPLTCCHRPGWLSLSHTHLNAISIGLYMHMQVSQNSATSFW